MSKTKSLFAALDAGTSAVKCIALDASRPDKVNLIGTIATPVRRDEPGQAEIEPRVVLRACEQLLGRLFRYAASNQYAIRVIGLTGHIGGAICVDRDGNAISPCAIWQDQRCAREADAFFDRSPQEITRLLGVSLPKGVCWPAPKIRWLQRHRPAVLKRTWKILQLKDYLFYHFTKLAYSEATTFLGLANIVEGVFHPEAVRWCGIKQALLPELRAPNETFPMGASWARRFPFYHAPLPEIGIGTADMTAAFLGCALEANEGALLANTAELIGFALPGRSRGKTPSGVVRVRYRGELDLIYGSTTNGGSSVDWFRDAFNVTDLGRLTAEAVRISPGCDGLLFLPYLTGERAPLWSQYATGAFVGLRASHTRAHLFRAVLEGCALSKRHVLDTADGKKHRAISRIVVCGGTARVPLWNQIRASVLGVPLHVPDCQEASALGALFLAADRCDHDIIRRYQQSVRHHIVQPIPKWVEIYRNVYQRYRNASVRLANAPAAECQIEP
jgi:xylulokinase